MKYALILIALMLNTNGVCIHASDSHASDSDGSEFLYSEEYLRRARENALKGDEDFDGPEISALEVASQDAPTLLLSPPQLTITLQAEQSEENLPSRLQIALNAIAEATPIVLVCGVGIAVVGTMGAALGIYADSTNLIQKYL